MFSSLPRLQYRLQASLKPSTSLPALSSISPPGHPAMRSLLTIVTAALAAAAISAHGSHTGPHEHSDDPLDAFLAPAPDKCIYYTNAIPPFFVATPSDCAAACLAYSGPGGACISFNICPLANGTLNCGFQTYNKGWALLDVNGCSAYLRIRARNDTRITPAVAYAAVAPETGVSLTGGPLSTAFQANIAFLLNPARSVDDLTSVFFKRADPNYAGPGSPWQWDTWVQGSVTGLFLMGAGGTLRWISQPQLQADVAVLLSAIRNASQANGFIQGFPEQETPLNQNPSYVVSWLHHGLLEAARGGATDALPLLRMSNDWWNNCTWLPQLFPQDGGPDHFAPPPPGWDLYNNSGSSPFLNYHMLYWLNQAGTGRSRVGTSSVGVQADVDFLVQLFQEDWWLTALINGDPNAIWNRDWYPDNYEITVLETYADMYLLTGNATYLNAVMGGWALFRAHWMFPGGSVAINENYYYRPGDLPLTYTAQHYDEGWGVETRPTGEMCASVFWTKLNQRLHLLSPDEDVYVYEMERSIWNVGVAGQGAGGVGVRYFANLHLHKQIPSNVGTCCEGQNARLFGSIHEHLWSIAADGRGLYVDMLAQSSITFPYGGESGPSVTATMNTSWPYSTDVTIDLTSPTAVTLDLALRMPAWVDAPQLASGVSVSLNGVPLGANGSAGTYVHTPIAIAAGSHVIVTYSLSMRLQAHVYTGVTQIDGYTRIAYMYGPLLLVAEGPWNSTLDCVVVDAAASGVSLDPLSPSDWMVPLPSNPLRFNVTGMPGYSFVPYFEIQDDNEQFTAYPIMVPGV